MLAGGTRPFMEMVRNDDGNPTHEPQTAGAYRDHCMNSVGDSSPSKQSLLAAFLAHETAFLHLASMEMKA